jgi:hypothetical protein
MPNTSIALLVTVARAKEAAITSIQTHQPEFVTFLTTKEFEHNIAHVLEQVEIPNSTNTQLTVHNNMNQTYQDALAALEDLQQHKPGSIYADLTSCTTPMSIAVWEACKKTGAIPHWIDHNNNDPIIHRLSLLEEE